MKTYILEEPVFIAQNGNEHKFESVDITSPTGRCRTALFQIKSIYAKSQIDMANSFSDNGAISEAVEEAKEKKEVKDDKKKEIGQDEIDGCLATLYMGGANVDACTNALIEVLCHTGKFNNEFECKKAHFEDLSFKDTENLLGFYLANFM